MELAETSLKYYLDAKHSLIVDVSGDGGDAAHFSGLAVIAGANLNLQSLVKDGLGMRHPSQKPWNNPHNFSRDQTMPLLAGLWKQGRTDLTLSIYQSHKARLFFCQNIDRDYPGTTKYPWPHKVKGKWRILDYRDPLSPHHIYALSLAAEKPIKWLKPIANITLALELLTFRYGDNNDQGAMIATCFLMKKLKLFKAINYQWEKKLVDYCLGWRRQEWLCEALKRLIQSNSD